MLVNVKNINARFDQIPENVKWNSTPRVELLMHKIHVYPAKFPSFLIPKSLQYARERGIKVRSIGDIFCGCGTTALEAKLKQKKFWGCDINPVATLIAKVKRTRYDEAILAKYFARIQDSYLTQTDFIPKKIRNNERIQYWYSVEQMIDVYRLLKAINRCVPKGKYRKFFLVAFSNILKKTSRWLTASIKPQIDPNKRELLVSKAFKDQYNLMSRAVSEANKKVSTNKEAVIVNQNFLTTKPRRSKVDMLITSPPYVTSYEYADLHQLSTLWLGYSRDYKELRQGTIGSLSNYTINEVEYNALDPIARDTYEALLKCRARSPKSVLKYFIDMKRTVQRVFKLVNPKGIAIFVIGNTTYKTVYINNAKYLTKCMLNVGFKRVKVIKRKISSKILTPYRDENGKFSSNKRHRKVYSYEFVLIARKSK